MMHGREKSDSAIVPIYEYTAQHGVYISTIIGAATPPQGWRHSLTSSVCCQLHPSFLKA